MSNQRLSGYSLKNNLPIDNKIYQQVINAEKILQPVFSSIEEIEAINQWKVLSAFQEEGVAQRHFAPSTGYGYDDIGRDNLERVFARCMKGEAALLRPQIVNGTHAIYLALSGNLKPGDKLYSVTGSPYDTLMQAIGISNNPAPHSLMDYGISYEETPLNDKRLDIERIVSTLKKDNSIKVVFAQRSRGYAWREAISSYELKDLFEKVRSVAPNVTIIVDNCYGEFTNSIEPLELGADLIAGSFIKNPGGGIAPTGGYIAGVKKAVDNAAVKLTVPGIGGEVGSYIGGYLPFYQGLFLAPHTTAQSLKTAALFSILLEENGYETMPKYNAVRSDIIQAIRFPTKDDLISFIQSIQKAAPVDSNVIPEPWDMPGYSSKVIMAAGTFIQGASIELSADAPIKEPYTAYLQGSLTYAHGRLAAMLALQALKNNNAKAI